MTDLNEKDTAYLRDLWLDTIQLREKVLAWAKETGYSASQLVSRSAEHGIEGIYGRKQLEKGE